MIPKHFLILITQVLMVFYSVSLHAGVWDPSTGHTQFSIWPSAAPNAQPFTGKDLESTKMRKPIAGKPWIELGKVSKPTMTVYSPKGKNTGVAVVVFPGGGYQILAIDLEGTEVCDWLSSKGITCVLLKYRVPGTDLYHTSNYPKSGPYPESPMALQDAQRTLRLVRFNAAKWHIDPHKIGVLGFSAGGHMVAATSNYFEKRLYPVVDAVDKESCRPDFAIAIYPGHLSLDAAEWDAKQGIKKYVIPYPKHLTEDKRLTLNPDLHVTNKIPPTFLLQAENDDSDDVENSLVYYIALKNAGVPVEMHLYAEGGHGFGLRRTNLPITKWPLLVETWLRTIGMVSKTAT